MDNNSDQPLVGIIMGSQSDWSTMKESAELLKLFEIPFETEIVSAHRTPKNYILMPNRLNQEDCK